MNSEKNKFIRDSISSHKVVIFSKTFCPYCILAKEQFEKLEVPIHVIELDERNDGDDIQDLLGEMTGCRTVPRCFINGNCVGGGEDVEKMFKSGTLQTYFQ